VAIAAICLLETRSVDEVVAKLTAHHPLPRKTGNGANATEGARGRGDPWLPFCY
jgi:hypothetical protein